MEDKLSIIGLGWTSNEDLIIIKENGYVEIRNMFGEFKSDFNLVKDSRPIDLRIFNTINTYNGVFTTGIAILTSKHRFVIIKDVYDPKQQQFPEIPSYFLISNN